MQNDIRKSEISTDQRVLVPTQLPRTEFYKSEVTISHVKMAAETPNLGCRSIFGPETRDEAKKMSLQPPVLDPWGRVGEKKCCAGRKKFSNINIFGIPIEQILLINLWTGHEDEVGGCV